MTKKLILALVILVGSAWGQTFYQLPSPHPGASNTNISLAGFPLGSEGPTISYTGFEALAYNAQTPQSQYYIGQASITGAVNPNSTSVNSGFFQCANVTPVTTSGGSTTADQNTLACTIPAGTLNRVGRTLRIYLAGVYSTPAASTTAINRKIKLCTVSGCGSGTVINLANITTTALGGIQATNDQSSLNLWSTTQTAGASSAYESHGAMTIDLGIGNTVADSVFADTNTATIGTIDSTTQLFLQVSVAFTVASASNVDTDRQLIVETVN